MDYTLLACMISQSAIKYECKQMSLRKSYDFSRFWKTYGKYSMGDKF